MNFEGIKAARKMAGITQEKLAETLGVNRATISKYESGAIEPSLKQIQAIAAALNVPETSLLYNGSIRIAPPSDFKGISDMTPEEIKQQLIELPKQFGQLRKSLTKFSDTLLDIHADSTDLLLLYYDKLNHDGRKEAIKRTRELTELSEYQIKAQPTEDDQPPKEP